jgi:hypothetical protein
MPNKQLRAVDQFRRSRFSTALENRERKLRPKGSGFKEPSLFNKIANLLIEKGLPEKVLRILQDPKHTLEERNALIQKMLFDNIAISNAFHIPELEHKDQQIIFRSLFTIIIKILRNRGEVSINPKTGQPYITNSITPIGSPTQQRLSRSIKQPSSYVGVCDVLSPRVARAFVLDFKKYNRDPKRKLMIGVMTSPVVLNPDLPVPKAVRDEITATFPKKEDLAKGFIDDPVVLNTIHYADLYGPKGPRGPQEAPNIFKNLELCVKYGGKNLHAIQLDVNWPDPKELKGFRTKYSNISIVLQVGKSALKACNYDPKEVVKRLKEYDNSVDHVLLDMSMGQGKAMISADLLPLLRVIRSEIPDLGLAVAGGFGPEKSEELKQVALEFPDISLDAQGRIKPDNAPRDSLGHLLSTISADFVKTRKYLGKNSALLD